MGGHHEHGMGFLGEFPGTGMNGRLGAYPENQWDASLDWRSATLSLSNSAELLPWLREVVIIGWNESVQVGIDVNTLEELKARHEFENW